MNKEKYIKYAKKNFRGNALKLVLNQIELFYKKDVDITKNKHRKGSKVFLKKGTFIHGIPGDIEGFDYVLNNGFISTNFTGDGNKHKINNSVGFWNIKDDMYLQDYINLYSGITLTYTVGRGPSSKPISTLVPYHNFDSYTEKIGNDDSIWMWYGEQTKEVRFIPSLVADKVQIAFILNMESDYAKKLTYADVWNTDFDKKIVKYFIHSSYYPIFLKERFNRDATTTDRESAIMFGLPASLIEGVFVGRKIEQDKEKLEYIKSKLPDCYICNLDGKVIK